MTARPHPRLARLERLFASRPERGRRRVLAAALGLAMTALSAPLALAQTPAPRIRFRAHPFTLGVASGYPRPDRVALWTRLAPSPLEPDGGMQPENVDVTWELAEDEGFGRVVASGRQRAVPELGHSVHVEAIGLSPGRWYHYRFRSGDEVSPVGRTRTADAAGAPVARLKLGLGSCQHFEQGYFVAHRHLLAEDLDLMLFVGDYLYENSWGRDPVRRHVGTLLHTLPDYRQRHAQYRSDPDLMRLHGAVPWMLTWDDHEVDNDYAGDQSEHLDPGFLARRAAAYQAYFEHMPLPAGMIARGARLPLHAVLDFGTLARLYTLDTRQYRSPQACPDPYKRGGSTDVAPADCPELGDRRRSLLGKDQERWLDARLAGSGAQWNLLAQSTLLAPFPTPTADGRATRWTDGWDGYPAARERLIASLKRHRTTNPIVLGGDLHATVVGSLPADPERPDSAPIAAEFCGTSINAEGLPQTHYDARRALSPHIRYANASARGYLTLTLTPQGAEAALRALDDEKRPDGTISTAATWRVEPGRPGVSDA